MTFVGDKLLLGEGVELGQTRGRLSLFGRDAAAFDETRAATLLTVALRRKIEANQLNYIRNALSKKFDGETASALTNLAPTRLPPLNRSGSWRLSQADELTKSELTSEELLS